MANEAARAKAGATFMDATCVGWPWKMDADTLDLSSCDKCVFGQAFDDHYINVCARLKLSHAQVAALGFTSDVSKEETWAACKSPEAYDAHTDRIAAEYRDLRTAWLHEIALRLETPAAEEARIEALPAANYACPL